MKKTRLMYILIFMFVVLQIYLLMEIKEVKNKLQQAENTMSYIENRISNNINDIYSNIDAKLKQQSSLVTRASFEVGEYNVETLKVPFIFKLQPKVLSNTTKVFLNFDDERILMIRQGTGFVLTKDFDLKDEIIPIIEIEDNGVSRFEENDSLNLMDIRNRVFSSIYLNFMGSSSYTVQEPYEFKADGSIAITSMNVRSNNDFKDIKYVVSIDDEVVKTLQTELTDVGSFLINDSFKLKSGQSLIAKVVATDQMNMTHEYIIFNYIGGEESDVVNMSQNVKIIAPNGIVVYETSGDEYY